MEMAVPGVQRGASSAAYVLAHFHSARALLREARPRILPDDVFAFSSLMKGLEAAVIHYMAGALAILEKRGGDFSQLVQPLADAESAAIELMHVLDRSGEAPKAGEPSSHPVFGLLSPPGAAQAPLLELALVVIAARREIEHEDAGRGAEVLSPGAVRPRRLRARRRRRVVMQVPIDVYAGDLELLRRAGLLSAGGSSSPEAVADALQILLARAFLSNPQHGSWRGRFSRQVPRLNSLGSSGDAQE